MKQYLKLMRPKHYIKNLLIFFPIIFSSNLLNLNLLISTIMAFFAFSLSTSIVYIVNDIRDKERDKLHEKKKDRPIASEKVSVKNAIILAICLFFISLLFQIGATSEVTHASYLYILVYISNSCELLIYTSIYNY